MDRTLHCKSRNLLIEEGKINRIRFSFGCRVAGICFTPQVLAQESCTYIPDFEITYEPDFRHAIADLWPAGINEVVARNDWGLSYEYNLPRMTRVMIEEIRKKLS